MTATIVAALRELSEPWPSGSKTKEAINRASRASGLHYWRTFDIWYGKARRIEPLEVMAIEDALARKREKAAQHEYQQLRTQIEKLGAMLATKDTDFYRPTLTDQPRLPIRTVGAANGGEDSTLD